MRFAYCIVALGLVTTIQASPEGVYGTEGNGRYFENNLDGIQGALEDISKAGEDLVTIENKLEALVDGSALIYKAESVLENSVVKTDLVNAWKSGWKGPISKKYDTEFWGDGTEGHGSCVLFKDVTGKTVDECKAICDAADECNAFHHNGDNGDCKLKKCELPFPMPTIDFQNDAKFLYYKD